jgi:hypothetical protein
VDLLTGCGKAPVGQQVGITSDGTASADFWHGYKEPWPQALMGLLPRWEGASCEGEQDLKESVWGRDDMQTAHFRLHGPLCGISFGIPSCSAGQTSWTAECFAPAVPNAAGMAKAAGTLDIFILGSSTVQQAGELMGGFLLAARVAGEGPMCLENPSAPQVPNAANPVTVAAPAAVEGPMCLENPSARPEAHSGDPVTRPARVPPQSMGLENPSGPQEAHAAGPMRTAACVAAVGPTCLEKLSTPRSAPVADPVTLGFPRGARPVESVQETWRILADPDWGILADPVAFFEASLGPSGPFLPAFRHPPVQNAGGGIRRATLEAHPGTDDKLPMEETDLAMTTALKLAVGLQIPCCKVVLPGVVDARFVLRE